MPMSAGNQQNGTAGGKPARQPPRWARGMIFFLALIIGLFLFFLTLVVCQIESFVCPGVPQLQCLERRATADAVGDDHRGGGVPPPQSPGRRATPSSLQIQVLGDGDVSIRDVMINSEKNKEPIKGLRDAVATPDIDQRLRTRIEKQMACTDGEKLVVSDFIRFPGGKYSITYAEKDKIKVHNFMCEVGEQVTKWRVFGFASEEGSRKTNLELSWKRACEVKKHISKKYIYPPIDIDRNTSPKDGASEMGAGHRCTGDSGSPEDNFSVISLGEEHSINGVADSRSVVIAACVTVAHRKTCRSGCTGEWWKLCQQL